MLSLVVFNIFHVFMLFINDEWNQHVQPSHLTIISAVRWLWKMWYLCRNDKWMCVNSSCGLVIWWIWWWVMNGCHGKLQIEKNVTNILNTQTHLSTVVVFFVHELMMHHQHTRKRYTWHSSEWWWLLDYYAVCSEMIGVLNWDLINDQKRLLHLEDFYYLIETSMTSQVFFLQFAVRGFFSICHLEECALRGR